jgi:hypothetical protein
MAMMAEFSYGKAIEQFEKYAKVGRVHGHREFIALTGRAGGCMIADGGVGLLRGVGP